MKENFATKIWQASSLYRYVFFFAVLALIVLFLKPQHYVSISRFQHYGLAITIFSAGYILESVFTAKRLNKWAKGSYLSTGLLFAALGITFWHCPWLDTSISVQTMETDGIRGILIICYLAFSIGVGAVWARWIMEENKTS